MNDQEKQELVQQWEEHFKVVLNEAEALNIDNQLYIELREIIAKSKIAKQRSYFYTWIHTVYSKAAAVSVRRLVGREKHNKTYSFLRLLKKVECHCELITRAEAADDLTFSKFCGEDAQHLPAEVVAHDIERLKQLTSPIKDFADQYVAHLDQRPESPAPVKQDLDNAIKTIYDLAHKYRFLICHVLPDEPGVPLRPWTDIFKEAWLPQ